MSDVELIGGPEKRPLIVVEYDPGWVAVFASESRKVASALAGLPHRVEHVGSTAVPGLAAKPIVDMQLSVPDVRDENAYLPPLEKLGYDLRVREPGHRMVRTASPMAHMHVCDRGSDWERRHLLFRDWLRTSPDDRRRYEAAKRQLVQRDWPTMNDYAAAKSDVIAEIMARAEAWALGAAWLPGREWPGSALEG